MKYGITFELQHDIVVDPILLVFGILGFIASLVFYKDMSTRDKIAGAIVGITMSIFSSVGLVSIIADSSNQTIKALSELIPIPVAALFFGFSGTTIVQVLDKIRKRTLEKDI